MGVNHNNYDKFLQSLNLQNNTRLVITDKNGVKIGKSQSDFKKYIITWLSHEGYKNLEDILMMRYIKIYRNNRKPNQIQYENSIGAMPILIYHGVDYTGYD